MTDQDKFWDRVAAKYAASPVRNQQAYEHTLARTRTYLDADDSVLEVGCGTGTTALLLADAVATITASDISGAMIGIAQQKAAEQGVPNVDFVPAVPGDLALATQAFDAVLAFNLLHLLPDLDNDLAAISQLLKPGGLLISKTPCLGEMNPLIRLAIPVMQFFGRAPYVGYLSSADLEARIAAAGFAIVESADHAKGSRFVVARKT